MKVGIVTVHDSSNLGSYLQALGMQELVKQRGDTPYIIETRSHFSTFCLYMGYNNAPSVRTVKGFIKFLIKTVINWPESKKRYEKYKTYQRDWGEYENVISVKKANQLELDVLLLGSDEIWNINQPAFQNPLLYGKGINAKRKYAYAISIGNAEKEKFKKFPELIMSIKKLDGILARDNHTKKVLEQYGLEVATKICDPTLQVDIRKYMKPLEMMDIIKERYIAVYSYSVDSNMIQLIKKFAKQHQLKTVAVSLFQPWCDEYVNCSPLEFGSVLKRAEYVYTSTFHGTIFSTLYHTRFVVNPASQKVNDVLELLNLEQVIINSNCTQEKFEMRLEEKRNFLEVENRIQELRKESERLYLEIIK